MTGTQRVWLLIPYLIVIGLMLWTFKISNDARQVAANLGHTQSDICIDIRFNGRTLVRYGIVQVEDAQARLKFEIRPGLPPIERKRAVQWLKTAYKNLQIAKDVQKHPFVSCAIPLNGAPEPRTQLHSSPLPTLRPVVKSKHG